MVKVADRRDVVEVLTHDHREVEDMFRELTAAADPAERRRIADDVRATSSPSCFPRT
jgi:hypothetical protein